jgi:hypothetical protein
MRGHPSEDQLKRFVRGGELPRPEIHTIVRHLLAGCPDCRKVAQAEFNPLVRLKGGFVESWP